jgi:hypothetical protein
MTRSFKKSVSPASDGEAPATARSREISNARGRDDNSGFGAMLQFYGSLLKPKFASILAIHISEAVHHSRLNIGMETVTACPLLNHTKSYPLRQALTRKYPTIEQREEYKTHLEYIHRWVLLRASESISE